MTFDRRHSLIWFAISGLDIPITIIFTHNQQKAEASALWQGNLTVHWFSQTLTCDHWPVYTVCCVLLFELYKDQDRPSGSFSKWNTHVSCFSVVVGVEDVSRQTEVGDFNDKVLRDKNVSRSQIAMNTLYSNTSNSIARTFSPEQHDRLKLE